MKNLKKFSRKLPTIFNVTIITVQTEDGVVALNTIPDEKTFGAFLENMLRETGIEDLLESAFYKVNGVSNESFEYFINRQLAQL